MAKEESLNKALYKIELYIIKVIPFVLALVCFINTTLSYFGIDISFLSYLGGISIFPLLFLYLSSYVFRFCLFHRLPLHYLLLNLILNVIDDYIGIPISNRGMYSIYLIITFIFILLVVYEHTRKRNIS
jgi:hypothetical protein